MGSTTTIDTEGKIISIPEHYHKLNLALHTIDEIEKGIKLTCLYELIPMWNDLSKESKEEKCKQIFGIREANRGYVLLDDLNKMISLIDNEE